MADREDRDEPAESLQRRIPGTRAKLWLLLFGDRWLVVGIVLASIFGVFVVLGAIDPSPLRESLTNKDPIETTFQAMLTAIVTGVTLVVTINQLVLSQELGPVGDQRDRMEGAMAFQKDVEEILEQPTSPSEPAAFLRALVERSRSHAETLESSVSASKDDRLGRRIQEFATSVIGNADRVSPHLEDAEFGTFQVMLASLDYDYSSKINVARQFSAEHGEELNGRTEEALDDLVEVLELFAPTREHFKTLYFQWELINLSRSVLYAAVPALVVAGSMILYLDDPATITGTTLGVDNLVWAVSGAITVTMIPFVVLLSYILRIATVAKRTLAIGPFVLRRSDGDDEFHRK